MADNIILKKIKIRDTMGNTMGPYDVHVQTDLEEDIFAGEGTTDDTISLKLASIEDIDDIFNQNSGQS